MNENKNTIKRSIFYGKGVCILGSLSNLYRVDVVNMLETLGSSVKDTVSKNSQFFVVGMYNHRLKSSKENLKRYDEQIEKGNSVRKLTGSQFKNMLLMYCDYSDIISVNDIFNHIKTSLPEKYLNSVELSIQESDDCKSVFIKALAKKTPWHPELSDKTIFKITASDIVLYERNKKTLIENNIEFTTDNNGSCHIKTSDFVNLEKVIISKITIDSLVSAFAFASFGCCSKFSECEAKKECCHDDVLYSQSCQHRAILK